MKQISRKRASIVDPSIILALCVILSAMASCSGKSQGASAPIPASRGSVIFIEGTVSIDGKPGEIGSALGAVTRIETGPASSCEIMFDGRNVVKIMQNTFADLDFSKVRKEIKLQKGGVAAVLKKVETLAGKDSFLISAPTAVAGVRGTTLCVWADADNSYVCACNGKVHTIDAKGSNEQDLEASHHMARLYSVKDGSISVAQAGMEHHTDAIVEALAAKIQYKIDWTKID